MRLFHVLRLVLISNASPAVVVAGIHTVDGDVLLRLSRSS